MRIKIFTGIILFSLFVLCVGLFYTQVIECELYRGLSERNRIRVLPLEAPRGKIYDRNGNLLVSNRISFDVEVIFDELRDRENTVNALSYILNEDKDVLNKRIDEAKKMPFVPVKIAEDVKKDKAISIEEIIASLPGIVVTTRPLRNYIYKNSLSHITGYLGEIGKEELKRYKTYGYRMKDFVGKDGVERFYNDYLRGTRGGLQVEVDSMGRQLRVLAVKEPQPGKDLSLTIDLELQKFCDSILKDKKGAIVVMDPGSGEVLALVSRPNFDPNIFLNPDDYKKITSLLNNAKTFPMLDRAISGSYPSGSVFKIVIALAALDSNCFGAMDSFFCNGEYALGRRIFHCWKEDGHGKLAIKDAMKFSCNVFFYQLGIKIGPNLITKYALKLGLGRPTGIDLPGEIAGLVPSPTWKRKTLGEPWYKGETANYAIGQGYLLVTPIQLCRMSSAIANEGKLVHPYLADRIANVEIIHPEMQDLKIKKEVLDLIKKSLKSVVNDKHGTGLFAKSKKTIISGKTGTAQNQSKKAHAWFTGFAPYDNPTIAIVVFVEHGGKGGLVPAKSAKKIIEKAKELKLL